MLTVLPSFVRSCLPPPPPLSLHPSLVCPFIPPCIPLWLQCDWYRAYGAIRSADCSAQCEEWKVERVMLSNWALLKGIIGTPCTSESCHIQRIVLDLQGNRKCPFVTSGSHSFHSVTSQQEGPGFKSTNWTVFFMCLQSNWMSKDKHVWWSNDSKLPTGVNVID